jgi:hypothetical protein
MIDPNDDTMQSLGLSSLDGDGGAKSKLVDQQKEEVDNNEKNKASSANYFINSLRKIGGHKIRYPDEGG